MMLGFTEYDVIASVDRESTKKKQKKTTHFGLCDSSGRCECSLKELHANGRSGKKMVVDVEI